MSTSAFSLAGERFARLWARGRARLAAAAAGLRPWLRREAWNAQGRRELVAAARRRPGRAGLLLGGALALAVLLVVLLSRSRTPSLAVAVVQEGPFHLTLVEAGTLQALRSVTYASSIQSNQAKIVALVPEGKMVQKNDLLILFDAAPFEEEIRKSQAALSQAQADLAKARQDYKLQEIQNREELASARQKVERSDLELKDVQEGKGRLKEEEARAAVANAERELKKAQTALEDLQPLLAEGFITKPGAGARGAGRRAGGGGAGAGPAPARLAAGLRPAARGLPGALGCPAHQGEPAPAGVLRRLPPRAEEGRHRLAADSRIQEAASQARAGPAAARPHARCARTCPASSSTATSSSGPSSASRRWATRSGPTSRC